MFDTHYATEVRETSGLVPVVGGLGAGKSVLLGQITYEAVRRGIPAVVLDPSGAPGTADRDAGVARHSRAPRPDHPACEWHLEPVRRSSPDPPSGVRVGGRLPGGGGLRRPGPQAPGHGRGRRCCCRRRSTRCRTTSLVISDAVRATRGEPGSRRCGTSSSTSTGSKDQHGRWSPTTCATWPSCRWRGCSSRAPSSTAERLDATPDRADHARARAAAAFGRPGALVDLRAAGGAAAAPGVLVRDPGRLRTRHATAASWSRWTRPTSSASGPPGGHCSPDWAATPASGTPACSRPRRTRPTCWAWTSPTSCRPRSSVGSRTRTPPATGSGCCASRPGVGYERALASLSASSGAGGYASS